MSSGKARRRFHGVVGPACRGHRPDEQGAGELLVIPVVKCAGKVGDSLGRKLYRRKGLPE